MDFVMSPADLEKIAGAALRIDPNPARLAGRVLGLGDAEISSGVQTWAWITLALGAGILVGAKFGPALAKRLPF
jgi:hypothetical protein